VAVPLLPAEEGYYFTPENTQRAAERYDEWRTWTAQHGLVWEGVGLDIEPEARFYQQIMDNPWGLVPMLLPRLADSERPRRAKASYTALIDRIHADGYSVENYQFPLIADERRTGSTLLQRLLTRRGFAVDLAVDGQMAIDFRELVAGTGGRDRSGLFGRV
jgi:LPS sulfotransferase NodH